MNIPAEFDLSAIHGFNMKGWDFTVAELTWARKRRQILNPAIELASNVCPLNCGFCFTESPDNPIGAKKRLKIEMSLDERRALIYQLHALGARSINFIGAGEPTIDPHFFILLELMKELGITPIIYTEGTLKLIDPVFVQRLFDLGATVVLKVNTLEDEAYQNAIVAGPAGRKGRVVGNYFQNRAIALQNLIDAGFNDCVPTRLAFDTIMCKENQDEILRIHRFARENNIFVLFVNYLPSGRSTDLMHNALSRSEQMALNQLMADFDRENYRIEHDARFPYGSMPCSIRGFGLYVKIGGNVFDCPGESQFWGNVRQESLATIWERYGHKVQSEFDGGCAPRDLFWERLRKLNPGIEIPT